MLIYTRLPLVGMALLTLTIPTIAQPKPYNPTDQAVNQAQRDYYAIPYAMQLTVLTDAIKAGQGKLDDTTALPASMAIAESFEVSVSNISTGKTADIQNEKLINFVTIPGAGQEVVHLSAAEPGNEEKYGSVKAKWGPMEKQPPANSASMTMQDLFINLSDVGGVEYDQYVAYVVTLRYQGQNVSYKALYLFSSENPSHHQIIDMYLQGTRYSDDANAYRPVRILGSSWRNIPALRDWLFVHTTTDSSCTQFNQLCCLSGHCAMRRSDFDRRMSQPIIGDPAGVAFRPQSIHRPSASLIRASSTLNLHRLFGLMMFQSGCLDDSPQYCACDNIVCTPLSQPYSTSPSASCAVVVHNRQVWAGFLPTGKYHNWITTVIRLAGYTSQSEIFDGGPTNISCPVSCGNIGSWASLPPEGVETGDTMTGGNSWWNAGGFSTNNCEGVLNIQSTIEYLAAFTDTDTYYLYGPNSNSVAFTAVQSYYIINDPPGGTPDNPGWGMFLP